MVYQFDPDDWPALDRYEGATGNNPGYDRAGIQVHTDSGDRDVTTYLARRGRIDESLKPYTWYLELIRCGAEQHGLPEDYRQRIQNTMAIPDPDEDRRAKRDAEAQIREYVSMRALRLPGSFARVWCFQPDLTADSPKNLAPFLAPFLLLTTITLYLP